MRFCTFLILLLRKFSYVFPFWGIFSLKVYTLDIFFKFFLNCFSNFKVLPKKLCIQCKMLQKQGCVSCNDPSTLFLCVVKLPPFSNYSIPFVEGWTTNFSIKRTSPPNFSQCANEISPSYHHKNLLWCFIMHVIIKLKFKIFNIIGHEFHLM